MAPCCVKTISEREWEGEAKIFLIILHIFIGKTVHRKIKSAIFFIWGGGGEAAVAWQKLSWPLCSQYFFDLRIEFCKKLRKEVERLLRKTCLVQKSETVKRKHCRHYAQECETIQFLVTNNIEPLQQDSYAAGCAKVRRGGGVKRKRYKNSAHSTFWHDRRIVCWKKCAQVWVNYD